MSAARPKRQVRTYSSVERIGLMYLAAQDGVMAVVRAHKVPERTLRGWFEEVPGGLPELRRFVEAETHDAFIRSQRAIFERVMRDADGLNVRELMRTYRAFIDRRSDKGDGQVAAGAAAQANVHIWNINAGDGDGSVADGLP